MNRHARFLSFFVLFLCCTLLFSSLFRTVDSHLFLSQTNVRESTSPVVLLDAGHGGEDGGATGSNGVLEKELNLSLTRTLADLLRAAGYTVIETRTDDRLLYDEGTQKGHKKQGDLVNRLKFTQSYPDSIFISIHMNTFPTPDCKGTQIWYSQNNEESKEWANTVQNTVKQVLQPNNNRKIKAATSSIYLLRHAQTPAILIECGFLSTPTECERLCDETYQKALAVTLFTAISEKMQRQSCKDAENTV